MSTLTREDQNRIEEFLNNHMLNAGIGPVGWPCSLQAINLALTNELTDDIPDCMSEVIGRWIITVQDSMPHWIRNSPEWKSLLPLAAGTGREKEAERYAIVIDWMWESLKLYQPIADKEGFGDEWSDLLEKKDKHYFLGSDDVEREDTYIYHDNVASKLRFVYNPHELFNATMCVCNVVVAVRNEMMYVECVENFWNSVNRPPKPMKI